MLQDAMRSFINALIFRVKTYGVDVYTNNHVTSITKLKRGFAVASSQQSFFANKVVYAGGRSSNYESLHNLNINYQANAHDLGIRINVPRKNTEKFSIAGKDVKLKLVQKDFSVRSFCVCSGGSATKVNLNGQQYWDGHFGKDLSSDVNIGIMARTLRTSYNAQMYCTELKSFFNEEVGLAEFLHKDFLNRNANSKQALDYLIGIRESLVLGFKSGLFDFDIKEASVKMPAVDNCTNTVHVDACLQTQCPSLYVIGDANGLSRGYIQSMWSGFIAAKSILAELSAERSHIWSGTICKKAL